MRRTRALPLLIALSTTAGLSGAADAVVPDPPGTVLVAPDQPGAVAVSPGRVVWQGAQGVRKAAVRSDGSTVTVGSLSTLGQGDLHPYGYLPHSSSGARTLWATETSSSGFQFEVKLTSGTTTRVIAQHAVPMRLSGSRVLYQNQGGQTHGRNAHYLLYDLHTGKTTDVTEKYGTRTSSNSPTVDLFGNYLVYTTKNFAIVRRNLADGTAQTIVPGENHPGYNGSLVVAQGDWVAWDRYSHPSDGFDSFDNCGLKNLRTMAAATHTCVTNLTTAGSLIRTWHGTGNDYTWSLLPYGSTGGIDLPSTPGATGLAIDGNVLAWGDADGLHAAPLADAPPNRPRSLGDPVTSATHGLGGASWPFRLVTTAPLTKCQVQITKSGALVRQLDCNDAVMSSGEVLVRWDGSSTSGHRAQPGTYRWTAYASNDDGSMIRSDGFTKPTTGTVTVTR